MQQRPRCFLTAALPISPLRKMAPRSSHLPGDNLCNLLAEYMNYVADGIVNTANLAYLRPEFHTAARCLESGAHTCGARCSRGKRGGKLLKISPKCRGELT